MKKLLPSNGTIKKVKRQPIKCEKVFANYLSPKALIVALYKSLQSQESKYNSLTKNKQKT
jgi:hypothetical protein